MKTQIKHHERTQDYSTVNQTNTEHGIIFGQALFKLIGMFYSAIVW